MFGSFLPELWLVGTIKSLLGAREPTLLWNHYTHHPHGPGSECNLTTSDTAWFRFGQECHTILLPRRRKALACFQFACLGGSWSSPFYIQFPSYPDTLYADESHCLASPEIRSDKDNPMSCFCRDTIADARYLYFAQTRVSQ